ADLEKSTDDLIALYKEVIEQHRGGPRDLLAESRAAAEYLYRFVPSWRDTDVLKSKLRNAEAERDRMSGEIAYLQQSATWRLRERIVRWKPLVGVYKKLL